MKYIKVKVHTNSNEDKIIQKKEDSFEIWTKQKPENNKANISIIKIISDKLAIPINKISIVKGHHSPSKILIIR